MSVIIVFPNGTDWFRANWVFRQLAGDVSVHYRNDDSVCKALESADVKQKLVGAGSLETLLLTPQDFNALIRRDYDRFGKLIRDIGVKAD